MEISTLLVDNLRIFALFLSASKYYIMKKTFIFCLVVGLASLLFSCEKYPNGCGVIEISLSDDYRYDVLKSIVNSTKAQEGVIPDTNQFVLSIISDDGNVIYHDLYGESSKKFTVTAGTYNLSVYSEPFSKPAFAAPQYGDSHTIYVGDGENVGVSFDCKQINAGLKLNYSDTFIDKFGEEMLMLKSQQGTITYGIHERRIVYFLPGRVQLFSGSGKHETLIFTRDLEAGKVLVMTLSASDDDPVVNEGKMTMSLDTTRIWEKDSYHIGEGTDGSSENDALNVTDLPKWLGAKDVWVSGFIVGGDVSTSSFKKSAPFNTASNLAIANSLTVRERKDVAAVELKTGDMRDELNLVDNPKNVGRTLLIKGDIVDYFGHPGVKNIEEYKFVY